MSAEAVCVGTNYSPWVGITMPLKAEHLSVLLQKPDSLQAAMELGRLDFVSAVLASIALLIVIFGLIGYGFFNWRVHGIAMAETGRLVPDSVVATLSGPNGATILRNALQDPAVLAALQARILELGIGNAPEAAVVDTDARRPETTEETDRRDRPVRGQEAGERGRRNSGARSRSEKKR